MGYVGLELEADVLTRDTVALWMEDPTGFGAPVVPEPFALYEPVNVWTTSIGTREQGTRSPRPCFRSYAWTTNGQQSPRTPESPPFAPTLPPDRFGHFADQIALDYYSMRVSDPFAHDPERPHGQRAPAPFAARTWTAIRHHAR